MNHAPARNPYGFLGTLWNAINFTRRLILNLLFFGLLGLLLLLVVIGMFSGGDSPRIADRTTLVIAPQGRLVEQYTTDPATRALARALGDNRRQEVQLRDVLRSLEAAKTDKQVERVLLRVDGMQFGGYAALREVAEALAEVRASGKQIVAFGETFDQAQYLLAAQADEIYLDPMGGMLIEGLGRYRLYYRELLQDKLGVDVQLFKVGEYKSAAEPFVRDDASPEAKEADLYWMNDIWQRYIADIAKARKLDAAEFAADLDALPDGVAAAEGDLAKYALENKLVDGLKTREEVEDLLLKRGVADEDSETGFRMATLDGYLLHLDAGQVPVQFAGGDQVAVVVAEGEIVGGDQPPGRVGGESASALLRDARDDEAVKAVVLRVNSPGGEVFASEQIRREVVALQKAGKPVVVSMGDLAASGGYWISMNADRIYADASTITGSIGIFGLIPTAPRALEKIGVRSDGVSTTRYAGAFDPARPLDPGVARIIQSVIDKGYRDFTGGVAKARKKPVDAVDEVARGRVWTGTQAMDRGLVDQIGGLDVALADAAKRAKLKGGAYRVRYMEPEGTPFERWLSGFSGTRIGAALLTDTGLARMLLADRLPQIDQDLRMLEGAADAARRGQVKAYAHCFCAW